MVLEGSDTLATGVNLAGNAQAQNEVVIYAPRSDVLLQGSPTVLKRDNLAGIDIPALIHYTRDR